MQRKMMLWVIVAISSFIVGGANADGLVLSLDFNEGAGEVSRDASVESNHGVLKDGATWSAEGKFGGALKFDGIKGYVDCGNLSSLDFSDSDFSLAVWTKTDSADKPQGIISKGNPYNRNGKGWIFSYRKIGTGNYLVFMLNNGSPAPVTINRLAVDLANKWHHVAVTVNRKGVVLFYLDGKLLKGKGGNISSLQGGYLGKDTVKIGKYGRVNTNYFSGLIDNVQVWNKILSSGEIKDIYQKKPEGK